MENNTTKQELLEHYAQREPTSFLQYDGFANIEPGDCFISPDEEGDCCISRKTWELMFGADVRILIKEGTTHLDTIRLIKKILKFIKKDKLFDCNKTN